MPELPSSDDVSSQLQDQRHSGDDQDADYEIDVDALGQGAPNGEGSNQNSQVGMDVATGADLQQNYSKPIQLIHLIASKQEPQSKVYGKQQNLMMQHQAQFIAQPFKNGS